MSKILSNIKKLFTAKNKLKRLKFALQNCLKFETLYPLGRFEFVENDTLISNYIENMEVSKYYTELKGGTYLNFLQPLNGEGRKQLSHFEISSVAHMHRRLTTNDKNECDLLKDFYSTLWNTVRDKEFTYDLRSVFYDYDDEIYFDQAHCSDIGYKLIAQSMAQQIFNREQENGTAKSKTINEATPL